MIDKKIYLQRIGYTANATPSLNCLRELQKLHLLHIPFENLDIHYSRPISLDTGQFSQKILHSSRGGFCYELNGLFAELLRAIGFQLKLLSARVYDKGKGYGEEYDHLALLVELGEEKWLVDVGFGEFTFAPLLLKLKQEQQDARGLFRINTYDGNYLLVEQKDPEGEWNPQYIFSTKAVQLREFEERCHYHQTSAESHFTRNKICTLPTEDGRISLSNRSLKIKKGTNVIEKPISSEKEFDHYLDTYFKIRMKENS